MTVLPIVETLNLPHFFVIPIEFEGISDQMTLHLADPRVSKLEGGGT